MNEKSIFTILIIYQVTEKNNKGKEILKKRQKALLLRDMELLHVQNRSTFQVTT